MPYNVSKKNGKYVVKKKSSDKVVATTDSKEKLKGVLYHREHGK